MPGPSSTNHAVPGACVLVAILISHHIAASLFSIARWTLVDSRWIKPAVFTWFRYLAAAVFLHCGLALQVYHAPWRRYWPRKTDLWRWAWIGAMHVLAGQFLRFRAHKMLPSRTMALSDDFLPVFVFVIGAVVGIEDLTWFGVSSSLKYLGAALALIANVLSDSLTEIYSNGPRHPRLASGSVLLLLSMLGFAAAYLMQKVLLNDGLNSVHVVTWSCTSCLLVLTLCMAQDLLEVETWAWEMSWSHVGMILFAGVVNSAFGGFLYIWALKFSNPSFVLFLGPVKPLVSALVAWVTLKDAPDEAVMSGAPLVVVGVSLLVWGRAGEMKARVAPAAVELAEEPPARSRSHLRSLGGGGGEPRGERSSDRQQQPPPRFPGGCVLVAILISQYISAGLFVMGKWASKSDHWMNEMTFTWFRFFVATLLMHIALVLMVRAAPWRYYFPKRSDMLRFFVAGASHTLVGSYMWCAAKTDLPGSSMLFWTALLPVFVWVIGAAVGVEDLAWQGSSTVLKVVGVTLAVVSGALPALLSHDGGDADKTYRHFRGNALVFLSQCGFAMDFAMQKVLLNRGYNSLQTATWTCTVGLLVLTPFVAADLAKASTWAVTGPQLGMICLSGAFPTAVLSTLSAWAMKFSSPAFVRAFEPLKPIIFGLLGWLVLREPLPQGRLVALPFVLLGLFMLVLGRAKELHTSEAVEYQRRDPTLTSRSRRTPDMPLMQVHPA